MNIEMILARVDGPNVFVEVTLMWLVGGNLVVLRLLEKIECIESGGRLYPVYFEEPDIDELDEEAFRASCGLPL